MSGNVTPLHMLIYNVRSFVDFKRRQSFANAISFQEIDVSCLSETWPTCTIPNTAHFLPIFGTCRGDCSSMKKER